MTHAELEEIDKLAKEATQGAWKTLSIGPLVNGSIRIIGWVTYDPHRPASQTTLAHVEGKYRIPDSEMEANAAYIAKMSPSTADRMVKRIKELEEALRGTLATMVVAATVFELPEARKEVHEAYKRAKAALAVSGEDVGK